MAHRDDDYNGDEDYEEPVAAADVAKAAAALAEAQILEALTDEECYLAALLQDASGLELAEFCWVNEEAADGTGCWRAWPFQWRWFRCLDQKQIDQCARAVGKSESIKARAFVFPFVHPMGEFVLTAPEGQHVEAIAERIEPALLQTRLMAEMIVGGRNGITHRPWKVRFKNGAHIISRIPQRSGIGVKGTHPIWLEMDECFPAGTLIMTRRGLLPIEDVAIGDEVLTHRRRWRRVTGTMTRERPTVRLRGHGHPGLVASVNHKFWAARTIDDAYVIGTESLHQERVVIPRQWIPATDMKGQWWSSPTVFPQTKWIPAFRKPGTNGKIPCDRDSPEFFWIVGLWIAEGTSNPAAHQVTFSIHADEVDHVRKRLDALGIKSYVQDLDSSPLAKNVYVCNTVLGEWLVQHCGKGARNKTIAPWMLGMQRRYREALLEGLVYGDGFEDPDDRYSPGRWKLTTSSKALAVTARLLALSLGYSVSVYWNDAPERPATIHGREIHSRGFYQVVGNLRGQGFEHDHLRYSAVRDVETTGLIETLYDLTVDEDHSFLADGICVSNSQDYPWRGWKEIRETLQRDLPGSQWRAHGVSKGLPDDFQKATQPGSGFTVHHFTAYHKPTWTAKERADKIEEYGSKSDPDYRRNVLGVHGDSTNPIFDLGRLMRCVDTRMASTYNLEEYWFHEVSFEQVEDAIRRQKLNESEVPLVLQQLLNFPPDHKTNYKVFWSGMDIGIVRDPSELLVFAEYVPTARERTADARSEIAVPPDGETRLKLLTRLKMVRFPVWMQAAALMVVIDFYQPKAVTLDATGNGLGVLQELQHLAEISRLTKVAIKLDESAFPEGEKPTADPARKDAAVQALTTIKGYNFGGKAVVEIDEAKAAELPHNTPIDELLEKAGVKRYVKDYATDKTRELVDRRRALFPYDEDLLRQMNGQTFVHSTEPVDAYGNQRRVYSRGVFHAFDGMRMAILGMVLEALETLIKQQAPKKRGPVLDIFI